MGKKCPKFTNADRKALALAAYLFYAEREFSVELFHDTPEQCWHLRVTREDSMRLEPCTLLNQDFIRCETVRVGYSDIVTTWTIPL